MTISSQNASNQNITSQNANTSFAVKDLSNWSGDIAINAAVQAVRQNAITGFGNDPESRVTPTQQISAFEDEVTLTSPDGKRKAIMVIQHGHTLSATCKVSIEGQPEQSITFDEHSPIFHNPRELREWLDSVEMKNVRLRYHPNITPEERNELYQDDFSLKDDAVTMQNLLGMTLHRDILSAEEKTQLGNLLEEYAKGYQEQEGYDSNYFEHLIKLLNR